MHRIPFLLLVFIALSSCSLFINNDPNITINYNGRPVQYSVELPDETEINLNITASDFDGEVVAVFLDIDGELIDITDCDRNAGNDIFQAEYTLVSPPSGEIRDLAIVVNDDQAGTVVKEIQLDCSAAACADPDNPVEIVIPEIRVTDGGILTSPEPAGEVFYYNPLNIKEESDIQLNEPIHGELYARRYLKVMGSAVPDDAGYQDREYHAVLFTVDNGSTKSYFTIPVNRDQRFRGYLYFMQPGTYTVMAYRAWNSYLYPRSRSTAYAVDEGSSTLRFTVHVRPGDAVPAASHHLVPTRNVDNGTLYLREYARGLVDGLTTELAQVKAVYEFLACGDVNGQFRYRYYDEIYPGYLDNCWSDIFIASHFLARREGVCNDFSELFAALTRALGFEVQKIWGYIPGTTGHQWNRINVGGIWYRLDATWGCGALNPGRYAEFYAEFDADYFSATHEETYFSGYTVEY